MERSAYPGKKIPEMAGGRERGMYHFPTWVNMELVIN
jgi:hypothetical protein